MMAAPDGLEFHFKELADEIDAFLKVQKGFLETGSVVLMGQYRDQLLNIFRFGGEAMRRWEIPEATPVRTIVSKGAYERGGRRGGLSVYASASSIWEIVPLGRKAEPKRSFVLVGLASTKIRVIEVMRDGEERELAMWKMEIADAASPGCHFHTQILGESGAPPFPRSLPIPRLPSIAVTPVAALEFILGELFQDRWDKVATGDTAAQRQWHAVQLERLRRLYGWHLEVAAARSASPWASVKRAKPQKELFA